MLIQRSWLLAATFVLALTGCGGSGAGVPSLGGSNSGGGSSTDSLTTQNADLFNLAGSPMLDTLEADQGIVVTSSRHASTSVVRPRGLSAFAMQITGGTATIARNNNGTSAGVGFLMTYRDASGLCECSNDVTSLPPPYAATLSNPLWGATPFNTKASTTTLGIGFKSNADSSNHGGTYTATVTNPPGGTAGFSIATPSVSLPRLAVPVITTDSSHVYASWTAVPGVKEYFLTFLTHRGNVSTNPVVVVGFIITDHSSVTLPKSLFYSGTHYEALLIGSDQKFIDVYLSQGVTQLPQLPSQIDFTVSQIALFTAP